MLPPPTPASISVPTTTVTSGSIAISWPAAGTATSYTLQESVNNGAWTTIASPTTTSYTRTGRSNGSYKYQLRSCNTSGCSSWKASSAVTVLLPPPAPVSISVPTTTVTNGSIAISWAASSTATSYTLQESVNNGAWTTIVSPTSNSYSRTGRPNGSYKYQVRACNTSGCSSWKASSAVTVLLPPPTPASISVPTTTVTNGSIAISWPAAGTATSYTLQESVNSGSWTTLASPTTTSYTRTVRSNGSYKYQVRACNASGCSGWTVSQAVTVVLPPEWMQTIPAEVPDATGSDTPPTEEIDLSAVALKGSAGVSGGQASYQIPIDLPPGRNGVQPTVSLSYNSQGGNGIVGVGWALNAGSAISRCAATYAQDGFTRAVTFDAASDRLCLDGQRLMAVSGTYGANGTVYRTEMDSFVKVVQSGGINSATASFIVYKPDGNSATYGTESNSRFAPSGLTTVLSWKVAQESFSNGANTIDYEYDDSIAGEHLLSNIYYSGSNERYVEFIYSPRNDTRLSFIAGGKISTQRRLSQINTYIKELIKTNSYIISYDNSKSSNRSLLTRVQQCSEANNNQQCAPATTFTWSDQYVTVKTSEYAIDGLGSTFYSLRGIFGEGYRPIASDGDINGDGVMDWPGYFSDAELQLVTPNSIKLRNRNFDDLTYSTISVIFDANQDGRSDSFEIKNNKLYIALTTDSGVGRFEYAGIDLPHPQDDLLNAGDYNGDGWPDLMIRKGEYPAYSNAKLYLYTHSQNPSAPYSENNRQLVHSYVYSYSPGTPSDGVSFIGDADGNGLSDVLISGKTLKHAFGVSGSWPRKFLLNQGNGFTSKSLPQISRNTGVDSDLFEFIMDINGDGLVDWLYWAKNQAKANQPTELWYRLNNGKADFAPAVSFNQKVFAARSFATLADNGSEEPLEFSFPKYSNAFKVADVDGDGTAELLLPGDRLLESCGYVSTSGIARRVCGDGIYGQYQTGTQRGVNAPIPANLDKSIYRYNAIKFTLNAAGTIVPTTISTDFIGTPQASMEDINGDGLTDMLFMFKPHSLNAIYPDLASSTIVNAEGHYLSRNYGAGSGASSADYQPVDYLQAATDGLGNSNEWRYRPLSTGEASAGQEKLYSTDHDEVGSGYVHFASSMYVVQSFKQSNGQGGDNETQYAYKGAMYNLQGRGFTGFNQIWEQDVQRNKTVHSTFKQKFPYVGLLTSQEVSVDGAVVLKTNNTWADNPQHSVAGVYHNILTNSVHQNWDLDGTKMSKVEQTIVPADVDKWGNIKKQSRTVTDYIDGLANSYTSTVETEFAANEANWWLRKFNWVKTSTAAAVRGWSNDPAGTTDVAQWQKQTVDSWDSVHKRPTSITVSASNSSCSRLEETQFNAYGLPNWTKVTGQDSNCNQLPPRQTAFSYTKGGTSAEADGYLPYEVTNAKGHVTKTEYDMGFGLPTKVTAPNSIVTATKYDAIGRPVQVKQTGSPTRYLRYLLASDGDNAPQDNANIAAVMTRTTGAGMPETEQYFDGRGRLLRSATQGFDGGYQYQDKHYDAPGRLTRESIPYGNGTAAEYTEFGDFDALDRPGRRSIPNGKSGGLESSYSYSGLKTDISVEGRTMSRTYGSQGWLYETVDAKSGSNRFAYDAAGRPLVIRDANTHDIKASYNGFGHKTQVIDPNQGTTSFGYNTLGEIDRQTDANGVLQTYMHDTLGRITSKVTTGGNASGTASFLWDSLKKGLLSSETENGVTRSYGYTAALQLSQTTVTVGTVSNTVKHQYDGFYGRPKGLVYPNGLTLQYTYNDYGYLNATSNAASGYVYREISTMDEAGHITGAKLANNIMTESRVYNPEGTMASVEVDAPLGRIHGHYYDTYDAFMNLRNERNGITGLEKSYAYDDLNRLSQYSFSNSGFALYDTSSPFAATVNYDYDKVGNLLKKTDYSANSSNAYRYGGAACAAGSNAGPNAVCQLDKLSGSTVSFQYDKRGNLRLGDGLSMTYNAMDKPLNITGRGPGNSTVTGFVYGSDNMRAKQTRTVSGSSTTTYYVDKYYEVDNDGSWRAYLDDVAVLSYTPQRSHLLQFTLRDRLGSATTLADQNGNIASQRYFDPFGRTATSSKAGALGDLLDTNKNRRGFTDHEHLNEQQLIHMNGRVYDYNLGRFMSVDPFIQSPTSTQSVNPYSYIMNNPLAGTDPTGYCSTGSHIKDHDVAGCTSIEFGSGGAGKKKKSNATITQNGANSYTASFQLGKNTTLEVDFKVNDVGSLGARNAMWTDQNGNPSSPPAGFNGGETVSIGVIPGPFGLPMPGPKSPEQIANDEAAAKALTGFLNELAGASSSPPPPEDHDSVEMRQPSRKVEKFENTIPEDYFNTSPRYQLVNQNGRWKTIDGNGNAFTPKGEYEFVTQEGQIWVSRTGTGHYNIARGANSVDYAGHIRFGYGNNRGVIRGWNNNSGHYKPSADRAWQARLPSNEFGKL
nr:RHS repeat-associated core domain-containing protein [Shewanella salipaludis]